MKEKILAKRYAEAFLEYARETVGISRAVEEFKNLKAIFYENPQLGGFLNNPEIALLDKYRAIDKIFKQDFSEQAQQFLKLLLEKGRMKYIVDICDYIRVTYGHGEALDAVLKTSYTLDLELIQKIKTKLENRLHKKINLYLELAPDLLGGIQIRVGNTVFDGSVRRRIDELRKKLMLVEVS